MGNLEQIGEQSVQWKSIASNGIQLSIHHADASAMFTTRCSLTTGVQNSGAIGLGGGVGDLSRGVVSGHRGVLPAGRAGPERARQNRLSRLAVASMAGSPGGTHLQDLPAIELPIYQLLARITSVVQFAVDRLPGLPAATIITAFWQFSPVGFRG
jgi:hypothetical protein